MSHEIPKNYITPDGISIDHKFLENRFKPTSDYHQLPREYGSPLETELLTDNLIYKNNKYIALSPTDPDQLPRLPFGITPIILQIKEVENNISYLPVEDDETLIGVCRELFKYFDKVEEELSRFVENIKKIDFNFKPRNSKF
ncbi:MAG: hypothetical protein PHP97_03355 [Candidatus Shapirobacteria bacterium]|nr:hypothetical protein [Candidatus Shapirobacteria bacterium]MDD3003169.1 hypothetical protein [Candidatus Shapirobacteria bacterium]MDD4382822.1 hypothetical protein [Candidatus Shapirobacteria bacterium]